MRFGIIVCPKCKKAKGVNLSYKTTKCIKCKKLIKLDTIKILYKTNSEKKLRQCIGLVNANIYGDAKDINNFINLIK